MIQPSRSQYHALWQYGHQMLGSLCSQVRFNMVQCFSERNLEYPGGLCTLTARIEHRIDSVCHLKKHWQPDKLEPHQSSRELQGILFNSCWVALGVWQGNMHIKETKGFASHHLISSPFGCRKMRGGRWFESMFWALNSSHLGPVCFFKF